MYRFFVRVLHKVSRSRINGSRLIFDTATFRKFINSIGVAQLITNTTETRDKSVESDGGIGEIITDEDATCHTIVELQRIKNSFSPTELHIFLCFVGVFAGF